jgi:ubiquinone/menaquinone biosynthesis C-methylase UbiE
VALNDYTDVTEAHGNQITREALDMMWTRYAFAARYCEGRDVLEVACGAGQGLGALAHRARRVVGGDYTPRLLAMARRHYGSRMPLAQLDAQAMPFRDDSFDVVVLFEALYYLPNAAAFVCEARRVLRTGGCVVACTVNCEWADFNPSPFSTTYPTAQQLRGLFESAGFEVSLYAGFTASRATPRDRVVSMLKQVAVKSGLMPKTMGGKRLLKRLFLGSLVDFPAEIADGAAVFREPIELTPGSAAGRYKVLYAVARA